MALESRKPIFDLTAADGAIGSHAATVRDTRDVFEALARDIGTRAGVGQWTHESAQQGSAGAVDEPSSKLSPPP
jgi:hypothetical protein